MADEFPAVSDREQRIARARRARTMRRVCWIALAGMIVAGGGYGLYRYSREYGKNVPGAVFASQGQQHVGIGTPFAYNSNPPSSGPHFASPANWGIYDYEVSDQIFIHNLEHGGIWIAYRPSIPASALRELKAIAKEFSGVKIVMAPRSANDADIALVAWSHVFTFDLSGEALTPQQANDIRRFYKALRDRGPEFVPGNMPGIDPKSVQ